MLIYDIIPTKLLSYKKFIVLDCKDEFFVETKKKYPDLVHKGLVNWIMKDVKNHTAKKQINGEKWNWKRMMGLYNAWTWKG